jgi:lipopolysaccharide transport system permease protein
MFAIVVFLAHNPVIMQFGLYVSPVGFSSNIVPEHCRLLCSVGPMVGVIDGFRWWRAKQAHLPGLPASASSRDFFYE